MRKLLTLTAIGTIALAAQANASGFLLREQSVSAMGNAFAGATAGAEDISYSFYNPAGLSRHEGTNVSGGATAIIGNGKLKNAQSSYISGGAPVNQSNSVMDHNVDKAILPSFYFSHQLDEKFTAGISVNSPFGLVTDYSDNWAGANHGTLSELTSVTTTPMLSYKALDNLSIGAGVSLQYVSAKLGNRVTSPLAAGSAQAKLQGDALDMGYVLGGLYDINDDTRVGVAYRSKINQKLKGDIDFYQRNGALGGTLAAQDINAKLTTPALLTLGVYHDINNKWSVMAEAQKTYWSAFSELDIKGDKGLNSYTHEGWKDVWFYSIGASYQLNDEWKLRAGIAYDQNPTNEATRTPRIPDSDRIWYSTGAEYAYDDNLTFNLGYTYIRGESVKIDLKNDAAYRGSLKADASADIHLIGLSANYSF